jgi:outer membrane protein TolC
VGAVILALALGWPASATAQPPPPAASAGPGGLALERLEFEAVVARAIERNPSMAMAGTAILRAEALLQQARSASRPRLTASLTNTTLDAARGFDDFTVFPQNQSLIAVTASHPVLAAAQWAARAQAEDQVGLARLEAAEVRQQIAVAAAQAYLAVIAQKRQVEVSQRALDTARAQRDFNQKRLEGGVGTRLNLLRSAQEVASDEALVELARLNLRRAQEALGVLLAADGPVDTGGEPSFEVPGTVEESIWLTARPDAQRATAQQRAAERVVRDSRKDWWPTGTVSFNPQVLAPAGLFQPTGTWQVTLSFTQPIYDGGSRRATRRQRAVAFDLSRLVVDDVRIRARAEVRTAREAVAASHRAFDAARVAVAQANEVLTITIVAFEAGASTNIEVIDAQRSTRDVETAAAQAEDRVRQARLDLLVALGQFPK